MISAAARSQSGYDGLSVNFGNRDDVCRWSGGSSCRIEWPLATNLEEGVMPKIIDQTALERLEALPGF